MIYDTLDNLERYVELSDTVATAVAFILMNDIHDLPMGRTVIDGENVFVNVLEAKTEPSEEKDFEAHEKYIDLQIPLEGAELFEVAYGETKETKAYNAASDCKFMSGVASAAGSLSEGRFAIFITGEAHKPGIRAQGSKKIKKAVFKILDDTLPDESTEEDVADV